MDIVFLPASNVHGTKHHISAGDRPDIEHVTPGEVINTERGYLRGHGTHVRDGKLVATVSGVVERVNKLVSVKPLKSRYNGEIGDVVVGRITEVAQNRWKADINGRQSAVLMLSSVNLPGGVQRRKNAEDQLQMRTLFAENDLISAEVKEFFADGAASLHTRSTKYGKLVSGQCVTVHPALVKRVKQHFNSFSCGVDVIFGCNGFIWLSKTVPATEESNDEVPVHSPTDLKTREAICRMRNCITALDTLFMSIHPASVAEVYEESLAFASKDLMKPEVMLKVTEKIRSQNQANPFGG